MDTVNTTTPFEDCDPFLDSVTVKVIKTIAYSILLLLSLVGNSVVPAVVYRNRKLHTNINYIIASMSISDLLMPIFAYTERIKQIYVPQAFWQIEGEFGSVLCKFRAFVIDTSIIVTVLSLLLVSIERFFAVVFPLKAQPIRNGKSCVFVIAFTWVFAMLYSSQNLYTWRLKVESATTYCVRNWEPLFDTGKAGVVENILFQFLFVMIPSVVLISLYCAIICTLSSQNTPGHVQLNQRDRMVRRYRQITYMLLTVVVIYLVPWMAQNIYVFLSSFVWDAPRPCSNRHVTFVLVYLGFIDEAINPYIYCIFSSRYRKGFQKILCRACSNDNRLPRVEGSEWVDTAGISQNVTVVRMKSIDTFDTVM